MTWLVIFCSLVFALGLLLGARFGVWLGERWALADAEEDRELAEATEWIHQAGQDDPEAAERREAMACRTHPVYRESGYGRGFDHVLRSGGVTWNPPELHHDEWEAHTGQALALARDEIHMPCGCPYPKIGDHQPCEHGYPGDEETDEEFTARMGAEADEIIAWAHAALAPYPGGEE